MNLPITHCRDFLRAPPFPLATDACIGSTIESATEYLDGKDVHYFIFFLIFFIHHLRLGSHLFRGWQLLKACLDKIDPVRKRTRPSAGRPLGAVGYWGVVTGKAGLTIGASSWGPSLAP